ncbi:hypothetical protein ACTVZO_26405 [Streptomyces sp. IBSNAI002]|uniref:hypothetical protein n=1 Tax=Streptomyces sp. IBSNAI002 TaxID=3457500 RepID=UPI003FD0D18F
MLERLRAAERDGEWDATALPDLPDLYEPLLLFCERGGTFLQDHAGYLDLAGVRMQHG